MKKNNDEGNTNHDENAEKNHHNGDEIRVLSADDEKIKVVGEVLANESSRDIMRLLSGSNEMTINRISQETDLSIPLVSHHLKKMQAAGVVKVSKIGTSVKGQKMKYYSATNQSFLITPPERQVHSLFHSLGKFSKFAAIGMAGLVSWSIMQPNESIPLQTSDRTVLSTRPETSTINEWSSASDEEMDLDGEPGPIGNSKEELVAETVSSEPSPSPEPMPSHSGIQDSALQLKDSDPANTGSVSLDIAIHHESLATSGTDSADPLIFPIIISIAVVMGGILLERILTRWYSKRKQKKTV